MGFFEIWGDTIQGFYYRPAVGVYEAIADESTALNPDDCWQNRLGFGLGLVFGVVGGAVGIVVGAPRALINSIRGDSTRIAP